MAVNYDELAKQFDGSEYDSMASEFGGQQVSSNTSDFSSQPTGLLRDQSGGFTLNKVKDIGIGATKELGRQALNIGAIPFQGGGLAGRVLPNLSPQLDQANQNLSPTNEGQQAGKSLLNFAELFLPVGELKGLKYLGEIGKLGRVAELGGKGLIEGAKLGGLTRLQGGTNEEVKTAGLVGAVGTPLVEGAFGLLKNASPKLADSIQKFTLRLSPIQEEKLGGKVNDVVQFLNKEVPVGTTGARYEKVKQLYNQAEDQLQNALEIDAKAAGAFYNKTTLVRQLEEIPHRYEGEKPEILDEVNREVKSAIAHIKNSYPNTEKIPLDKLNILKRSYNTKSYNKFGQVTSFVHANIGDVMKEAIEIGTEAKNLTVNGVPVQEFNQRYGTIIDAKKLLNTARHKNAAGIFARVAGGLVGEGIATATGGGPIAKGVGFFAGEALTNKIAGLGESIAAKVFSKTARLNPSEISGLVSKINPVIIQYIRSNGGSQ